MLPAMHKHVLKKKSVLRHQRELEEPINVLLEAMTSPWSVNRRGHSDVLDDQQGQDRQNKITSGSDSRPAPSPRPLRPLARRGRALHQGK